MDGRGKAAAESVAGEIVGDDCAGYPEMLTDAKEAEGRHDASRENPPTRSRSLTGLLAPYSMSGARGNPRF